MKRVVFFMVAVFVLSCSGGPDIFGEKITLTDVTPISTIIADIDNNHGKEFLVEGIMIDVCQEKGCWMEIKDGENVLYVRFKDYGFFMPKDGIGRKAIAQGIYTHESYEDELEDGSIVVEWYHNFVASGVILEPLAE